MSAIDRTVAVAAFVMALAAPLGAGQGPTPLSLQDALGRALESNPAIAAARLQKPVDVAGIRVAGSRPDPEVTFEASRDAPKESLGISWPIELGGKRGRRMDLARAVVTTGEAELERVIAGVQNEVRRSYFTAVGTGRLLVIATDVRALALRARDAAKARADAGDVPQADVAQTELALAAADDEVTAARGEETAARALLNALLGQPSTTTFTLSDDLVAARVPSLEEAQDQALQGNRELRAMDRRVEEQRARQASAYALQKPDLTIGGGVTWDAQPEFAVGWRASAGITLPLFPKHSGMTVREAAELTRLQAERTALAARVAGDVAAALARVSAARERMAHFESTTLPQIQAVERFAQDSYAAGQTPLSALLQALQQTRDSRKAGLQAAIDFQAALADLERAIGAPIK